VENRLNAEMEPGALFAERPHHITRIVPFWRKCIAVETVSTSYSSTTVERVVSASYGSTTSPALCTPGAREYSVLK
jgi:hypothetical protein